MKLKDFGRAYGLYKKLLEARDLVQAIGSGEVITIVSYGNRTWTDLETLFITEQLRPAMLRIAYEKTKELENELVHLGVDMEEITEWKPVEGPR